MYSSVYTLVYTTVSFLQVCGPEFCIPTYFLSHQLVFFHYLTYIMPNNPSRYKVSQHAVFLGSKVVTHNTHRSHKVQVTPFRLPANIYSPHLQLILSIMRSAATRSIQLAIYRNVSQHFCRSWQKPDPFLFTLFSVHFLIYFNIKL